MVILNLLISRFTLIVYGTVVGFPIEIESQISLLSLAIFILKNSNAISNKKFYVLILIGNTLLVWIIALKVFDMYLPRVSSHCHFTHESN